MPSLPVMLFAFRMRQMGTRLSVAGFRRPGRAFGIENRSDYYARIIRGTIDRQPASLLLVCSAWLILGGGGRWQMAACGKCFMLGEIGNAVEQKLRRGACSAWTAIVRARPAGRLRSDMPWKLLATFLIALTALSAGVGGAAAKGGDYIFDGGTAIEQGEVKAALDVSSFPWSVVRQKITIHIAPGMRSEATPGNIWLDSNLVDSGTFSWAIIQHEYAHQIDFLLFNDAIRGMLLRVLGGRAWCWATPGLDHDQYGCERFASTLTWAFWPSDANSLQPLSQDDESAAMAPRAFKALIGRILNGRLRVGELSHPAKRLPPTPETHSAMNAK